MGGTEGRSSPGGGETTVGRCRCAKGRLCVPWKVVPNPKACWELAPAVETGVTCDPVGSGLPGVKMHVPGLSSLLC